MPFNSNLQKESNFHKRESHIIDAITKKLSISRNAFLKAYQSFIDYEIEVDQQRNENNEHSRRRKSNGFKAFEFQNVSSKTAIEDLNLIYEGEKEHDEFGSKDFKKNDHVVCILDKKKFQGTVATVNQKGLVVLSKDRRKIRMTWEEIENGEVQLSKVMQ